MKRLGKWVFILGGLSIAGSIPSGGAPAFASGNPAIHYLVNQVALKKYLRYQCDVATQRLKRSDCREASAKAADLIDLDGLFAFSSDTVELLETSSAQAYLRALAGVPGLMSFSGAGLWDFTLRFTGFQKARAVELIALLLQDTTDLRFVAQLRDSKNAAALEESLLAIETIAKRVIESPSSALYPPGVGTVQEDANVTSQYHFYVMAHLAYRLREAGVSQEIARGLAFALNQGYENARFSAAPGWGRIKGLLAEPKPMAIADREADYWLDGYLGFAGAAWGAALFESDAAARILSFPQFQQSLSQDPVALLRSVFSGQ